MCRYEHCSHFVSFQRNNVKATYRDHHCRVPVEKEEYTERCVRSTLASRDVHM